MAQVHCEKFPTCLNVGENQHVPECELRDCPGSAKKFFSHLRPLADACVHEFGGWRDHKDGEGRIMGGEQVCKKCDMGAMEYTLRTGL